MKWLLLLVSALVIVQPIDWTNDWTNTWMNERACVPLVSPAPEDLTFSGALITYDSDGVRAYRAGLPTTYFIAFGGSNFNEGGALSPDGRWYAVPHGTIQTIATSDVQYRVNELRIYTTGAIPQLRWRLPWSLAAPYPTLPTLHWLAEDTLVYGQGGFLTGFDGYRVDVSDGSMVTDDRFRVHALSPDGTRGFLPDADQWRLVDLTSEIPLADFPRGLETRFTWSLNSEQFVILTADRVLMLYDRDGRPVETMLTLGPDRRLWNLSWVGERHLLFSLYDPYQGRNPLYRVDLTTNTIVDLCVELVPYHDGQPESAVIGSPDGEWIAVIAADQPDRVHLISETARYDLMPYVGGFLGWTVE
ncbi:MAG: hypothetical protein MUF87_04765 [Anaerolineae bacterium]|nr:hypothetical protein [Anaerolineae bacterium]